MSVSLDAALVADIKAILPAIKAAAKPVPPALWFPLRGGLSTEESPWIPSCCFAIRCPGMGGDCRPCGGRACPAGTDHDQRPLLSLVVWLRPCAAGELG